MAFRKQDLARPHVALAFAAPWKEKVLKTTSTLDEHGLLKTTVSYPDERCEDRSEHQLSPDEVNLDLIIQTGRVIDPSKCMKIFQNMDKADLEEYKDGFSADMLKFMTEHLDELKQVNSK